MAGFGWVMAFIEPEVFASTVHGLKVVAVAAIAQALWGMGKNLGGDSRRILMAVAATLAALARPDMMGQTGVILGGAILGWWLIPRTELPSPHQFPGLIRERTGGALIVLYFLLLLIFPMLAASYPIYPYQLVDRFYRAGAWVFGGGHVVLPLLQSAVVPAGWVTNDRFLAGYGAAQAVPGPLFTFAAYLGAVSNGSPHGWLGAGIALLSIFLPGYLLVTGSLPLWDRARHHPAVKPMLLGVHSAVIGLLLASFIHPVWSTSIATPADGLLALLSLLGLMKWKFPPWVVVMFCVAWTNTSVIFQQVSQL